MSDEGASGSGTESGNNSSGTGQPNGSGSGSNGGGATPSPSNMPNKSGQQGGSGSGNGGNSGAGDGKPDTGKAGSRTPEQEIAHWKEMARKQEERAKDNAEAAKNWEAHTESQKSEIQKAQDRASKAEGKAKAAEESQMRLLSAARHELHHDLVDFLGGGTAAQIDERADTLVRVINERVEAALTAARNGQPVRQGGYSRPTENLRPGAQPSGGGTPSNNPNNAFRDMISRMQGHS